jgi:micrococcal nuclease
MLIVPPHRPFLSVLLAGLAGSAACQSTRAAPACTLEPGPSHVVVRVEAANTLKLDDGTEVVLVGTWPPTLIDAETASAWRPAVSAKIALASLVEGRSVDLAFSGRRTDRYGRRLAHVFVAEGDGRVWVQGRMIEDGWVRAMTLPGNAACLDDLIASEREARANARGLWGEHVFQDHATSDPRALGRLRDTFQTVSGRVGGVMQVRGEHVLTFTTEGLRGFHVTIPRLPRGSERRVRASGWNDLIGKRVRVRGFLERRTGPSITLSDRLDLEVLDDAGTAEGGEPAPGEPRDPTAPIPVATPTAVAK